MAWLALAMKQHWAQVRAPTPYARTTARTLRSLGSAALVASLGINLLADHASIAPLVFIMESTASALSVAFVLAYRPRWLAFLALGIGRRGHHLGDEETTQLNRRL